MDGHRVDRLWPDPAFGLSLDDALASFAAPPARDGRPGVAMNMVTSIDGRAQREGTAEGLAGRVDRLLMRHYRARFDAVLSGSGTLLATGVWLRVGDAMASRRAADGRPPNPIGVVVAGEGGVPPDARWFTGNERRVLFVGSGNPMGAVPDGTDLERAPDPRPRPEWVLSRLAERGVRSVLLEGGPRLNAAFVGAGLVDELYWTVGPLLLGSDTLPMVAVPPGSPETPVRASLAAVLRHDDELMLRYRLHPGGTETT